MPGSFFDLDGLSSADDGQVIPAAGQKVPTLPWASVRPTGHSHFYEKIQQVRTGNFYLAAKNSRHNSLKKPSSVKKMDGSFFPKNDNLFQSPRNSGIIFFWHETCI